MASKRRSAETFSHKWFLGRQARSMYCYAGRLFAYLKTYCRIYLFYAVLIAAIILSISYVALQPAGISGMAVQEQVNYLPMNLNLSSSASYPLGIEGPPSSVLISGIFAGNGYAKVYLSGAEGETLLFDSTALKERNDFVPGDGAITFEDVCENTCGASDVGKDARIMVEMKDASLTITGITYSSATARILAKPAPEVETVKKNEPPQCDIPLLSLYPDARFTIDIDDFCTDPEGDTLNYSVFLEGMQATLNGSYLGIYVPAGILGYSTGTLSVSDGTSSIEENLTVRVLLNASSTLNESLSVTVRLGEHSRWVKHVAVGYPVPVINITLPKHAKNISVKVLGPQETALDHGVVTIGTGDDKVTGSTWKDVMFEDLRIVEDGSLLNLTEFHLRNYKGYLQKKIGLFEHRKSGGWRLGKEKDLDTEIESLYGTLESVDNQTNITYYATDDSVILEVSEPGTEYEVEYYTFEPNVFEMDLTDSKKLVTITSEEHYSNIMVSTTIQDTRDPWIKVSWLVNSSEYDNLIETYSLEREPCISEECRFDLRGIDSLNLTFIDNDANGFSDEVRWIVPHLSNETFEVENNITIIDIVSYSVIGDKWIVQFNTTGVANLTITPVNNTLFETDLTYTYLKCGNKKETADYNATRLFLAMYNCSVSSYLRNEVLTAGPHTLEFRYGNDTKSAYNYGTDEVNLTVYILPDPALAGANTTVFGRLRTGDKGVSNADLEMYLDTTQLYYDKFIELLLNDSSLPLPTSGQEGYYNYTFIAPLYEGLHDFEHRMFINTTARKTYVENHDYFTVGKSQMHTYDQSDYDFVYVNQIAMFYANYTYHEDAIPVSDSTYGGRCYISFNLSSGWTNLSIMRYNASSHLYEHNRTFNASAYEAMYNVSCYVLDGLGNMAAAVANISYFSMLPTGLIVESVHITPEPAFSNDTLGCYATVTGQGYEYAYANFTWYINSDLNISFDSTVNCSIEVPCYSPFGISGLDKHDNYTCSAFATIGSAVTNETNSTEVEIHNRPPSMPMLLEPTDGNDSVISRIPTFRWEESDDPDNDTIKYYLNITNAVCPDMDTFSYYLNYTPIIELCTHDEAFSNPYLWRVMAYDGENYSDWTGYWNFSIQPVAIVELKMAEIQFGELMPGNVSETGAGAGFVIENSGTVFLNLSIMATNPFESVTLEAGYLQTRANQTNETGSFNLPLSLMDWVNLSETYQPLISYLNHSDMSDEAEIDLRVEAPLSEPAGTKTSVITILGEQS